MAEILQGTTPSLEIVISESEFLVSAVTKLELTVKYNGQAKIYGLNDVIVDTEANSFIYTFTEEETLAMNPNTPVKYQLRFMLNNGKILGTDKMTLNVMDLMSGEVMTG